MRPPTSRRTTGSTLQPEPLILALISEAAPWLRSPSIWIARSKRRRGRRRALNTAVPILGFDAATGRKAAEIRHAMARRGEAIGPLDTLIAGSALAHRATLVTRNVREFARVPGLEIVNWYE
ncbi:MAG: PIN domain-containing protein [Burkholderiales bacterium]|nr:PIN domain-containing protein [Burkholderiales bacterium]